MAQGQADSADAYRQLFLAVGEELKLPLQHIGRQAELARLDDSARHETALSQIQHTADMTTKLLDSYLLSLRLGMESESRLSLSPVSLPAVLQAAQAQLQATARPYGITLCLHVGRTEPVLTNVEALTSALVGLGYGLIAALPASSPTRTLQLAAHRTRGGTIAGIYGAFPGLTPGVLRRGRQLHGHVRQPLVGVSPGPASGVFVADTIARAMQARLRTGRFHRQPGFAITLPASDQLQLV